MRDLFRELKGRELDATLDLWGESSFDCVLCKSGRLGPKGVDLGPQLVVLDKDRLEIHVDKAGYVVDDFLDGRGGREGLRGGRYYANKNANSGGGGLYRHLDGGASREKLRRQDV